ncbi:UNVERIFIED_CONTAM: hypothetical protein RKD50_000071 [Streptomyces canus]
MNVRQSRHHGATNRSRRSSGRPIATSAAPPSESAYKTGRSSPPSPQKKKVPPAASPANPSSAAPEARWTSSTWSPRSRSKSPGQARKRAASSCSRTAVINDFMRGTLRLPVDQHHWESVTRIGGPPTTLWRRPAPNPHHIYEADDDHALAHGPPSARPVSRSTPPASVAASSGAGRRGWTPAPSRRPSRKRGSTPGKLPGTRTWPTTSGARRSSRNGSASSSCSPPRPRALSTTRTPTTSSRRSSPPTPRPPPDGRPSCAKPPGSRPAPMSSRHCASSARWSRPSYARATKPLGTNSPGRAGSYVQQDVDAWLAHALAAYLGALPGPGRPQGRRRSAADASARPRRAAHRTRAHRAGRRRRPAGVRGPARRRPRGHRRARRVPRPRPAWAKLISTV